LQRAIDLSEHLEINSLAFWDCDGKKIIVFHDCILKTNPAFPAMLRTPAHSGKPSVTSNARTDTAKTTVIVI
jgi:hypothetical protein